MGKKNNIPFICWDEVGWNGDITLPHSILLVYLFSLWELSIHSILIWFITIKLFRFFPLRRWNILYCEYPDDKEMKEFYYSGFGLQLWRVVNYWSHIVPCSDTAHMGVVILFRNISIIHLSSYIIISATKNMKINHGNCKTNHKEWKIIAENMIFDGKF